MYASYLQEASRHTNERLLKESSEMMTEVGDEWRKFAQATALMCKNRKEFDFDGLASMLEVVAKQESAVYENLKRMQ
jgi:hypothetical protein